MDLERGRAEAAEDDVNKDDGGADGRHIGGEAVCIGDDVAVGSRDKRLGV